VFRKCTDFYGVLLQHISKFISLFEGTEFSVLTEYMSYRAWELYCKENVPFLGHPVAAAIIDTDKAETLYRATL
jgi:hypothetical protein